VTTVKAAHGSATLVNGVVTYTAPSSGSDTLSYTVVDQFGDATNGTLNVAVDSGPVASAASIMVVTGQSTDLTSYLLSRATPGIAGDTLTLTGDNTVGTHGTLMLVNGALSYLSAKAGGSDSFGYTVSDNYGDTASATVTVAALPGNFGNSSGTIILNNNSNSISFGNGTVTVIAGNGSDQISGGNANDTIIAGNGSDSVLLGNGANTVTLGNGNDLVVLGNGANTVALGNGNDIVVLGNGANTVTLGTGSSAVFVGNQNNTITLIGSASSTDAIIAGNGNNKLNLGSGTYDVAVGNGADTIILGNGKYNVATGNGTDLFIYTTPTGLLTMSFSSHDEIVFRNSGFDLGTNNGHGTSTPQAIAASLFSSNTNGTFATTANRFAYDQSTGNLYYDASGSAPGSNRMLIADFINKPHLTAASLFFTS
jgi:Ca2+-binding RTX toxin-like protein